MSAIFKFLVVFALAILGMVAVPKHACRLSSSLLFIVLAAVCLVLVPLIAARSKKSWVTWVLSVAAPFVTGATMFFYVEVLHWEHFPKWLLDDDSPKLAAPNAGIASQLTIVYRWPGAGEPGRSTKP